MRPLGKYDVDDYTSRLNKEKVKLYLDKTYKLISYKELLNIIKSNKYCINLGIDCEIKTTGLRSFLKHIKTHEKMLSRHLIYFPEENKRRYAEKSYDLPIYHATKDELEDF